MAIQRCLDRLPAKHREVIQLRFFVGDSIEGIAAALDCSVGTVKSRLFHALEKLHAMPELGRKQKGLLRHPPSAWGSGAPIGTAPAS
jgi:RNA polymerase sigma-70 factor (ECF subfamily)